MKDRTARFEQREGFTGFVISDPSLNPLESIKAAKLKAEESSKEANMIPTVRRIEHDGVSETQIGFEESEFTLDEPDVILNYMSRLSEQFGVKSSPLPTNQD